MGLYDRNYQGREIAQDMAFESESALVGFVKTTYKFFAASLLLATIGAIVGLMNFEIVVNPAVRIGIFVAEIAALLALMFLRSSPGLNVALLFVFTFLTGVALVPLLGYVISKQGLSAVWQALGMTTIVFGAMSIFAIKTKADLGNMGKMLFIALIVVIVCSLVNVFFLHSTPMMAAISGACVILFSLYTAYDTQNIIRGRYDSPIMAVISLYLDFLNIFISLLQLIGIFGKDD
ncbi:hypothetical protein BKN38_03735 [Helicobacter sp. CLO-3]|uniref:Bax inhibitor-1/YccA family protein n=1 Tax=unclassified Helicobacter TaxID=2593540 RepID=UPI0008056ADF|nr:hypothetical protein BA723_06290 [Helicobacter sp. CLO-3]OHU84147.1 hypothetical protein BKN38_03735 [Helicobacter sp. CLO-3]